MGPEDAKVLLEHIGQSGYKRFSQFESLFIESVTKRVAYGQRLTPKQAKTLEGIYRKTHGGRS